ncbi:MAG TPA: hypothetical protein VN798_19605, partial [Pseudomonas sp.]|nr:hypothetical protein [Pseudomonas sp.]
LGNIGGFVAPMLKANMEIWTADPRAGMLSLSAAGVVGVILLWTLRTRKPLPPVAVQAAARTLAPR